MECVTQLSCTSSVPAQCDDFLLLLNLCNSDPLLLIPEKSHFINILRSIFPNEASSCLPQTWNLWLVSKEKQYSKYNYLNIIIDQA